MKNLISLMLMSLVVIGMTACSSAQKEETADMEALTQDSATLSEVDSTTESLQDEGAEQNFEDSSLGIGSSGLGH